MDELQECLRSYEAKDIKDLTDKQLLTWVAKHSNDKASVETVRFILVLDRSDIDYRNGVDSIRKAIASGKSVGYELSPDAEVGGGAESPAYYIIF
jgi:hypothetical protein